MNTGFTEELFFYAFASFSPFLMFYAIKYREDPALLTYGAPRRPAFLYWTEHSKTI